MTTDVSRRAAAKFLAADDTDLDKLRFLRRLVVLAREMAKGRPLLAEDREGALQIVANQSPRRSWNRSRLSEARLVMDHYREFDRVVEHLAGTGRSFTWHDVIAALRSLKNSGDISGPVTRKLNLRSAISRFAKQHGLEVVDVTEGRGRITATFALRRTSRAPSNTSLERTRDR